MLRPERRSTMLLPSVRRPRAFRTSDLPPQSVLYPFPNREVHNAAWCCFRSCCFPRWNAGCPAGMSYAADRGPTRRERALHAILRQLYALWPPAYHRYYLRGPDSGEPFLTYREWRGVTDELRETLQLHEIMGQAPDSRVMELRRKLLLAPGEQPEAPEAPRAACRSRRATAGSRPTWQSYTPYSTPGSQATPSLPISPSTSLPRPPPLSGGNSTDQPRTCLARPPFTSPTPYLVGRASHESVAVQHAFMYYGQY